MDKNEKTITSADIRRAETIREKYKQGKSNLERRVIADEQWYKLQHWQYINAQFGTKKKSIIEPKSGWLFNVIMNKHADAMDSFPEATVLPREESDKVSAEMLSKIIPVVLEQQNFKRVYNDNMYPKIKHGTSIYGVFWDKKAAKGLGDIKITAIDILNIFWEPGIEDIQESANLFICEAVDAKRFENMYPQLKGIGLPTADTLNRYEHEDAVDTSSKTLVVDWYYKKIVPVVVNGVETTREVLHYVKYCGDVIIYSTENDPERKTKGLYNHGKYPVVFDTLFPIEDSPCGFGFIDIAMDSQIYIDKLNQLALKNAMITAQPRFFIKQDGSINKEQFADFSDPLIRVEGNLSEENIRQFKVENMAQYAIELAEMRKNEMKEVTQNTDSAQGIPSGGVTAASAIAALQESGSKVSRDITQATYTAYTEICYLVIELIRQNYTEPRQFRITEPNGSIAFQSFGSSDIVKSIGNGTVYEPIFDITVATQKKSAYAKVAQNEMAMTLYNAGFFRPDMAEQALIALELMDFEGKDTIRDKISEQATLLQELERARSIITQLTGMQIEGNGEQQTTEMQTGNIPVNPVDAKLQAIDKVVNR